MEDKIDQKIKNILKDLGSAHIRSQQFYGKELKMGKEVTPVDFFEMALAFDSEEKLLAEFELALSEKFPEQYDNSQKTFLKQKIEKLTRNIRAWELRQMPSERDR